MAARRKQSITFLPALVLVALAALVVMYLQQTGNAEDGGSEPAGYVLRFSPEFKPALANRDDLGISVVLAVDVSGSMSDRPRTGGKAKYIQASEALAEVLEVLGRLVANSPENQIIKLGIIRFSDKVYETLEPVTLDAASIGQIGAWVSDPRNLQPGGGTAIGQAIERGVEWLAQSGTILRSLIVVSDGVNTQSPAPEEVLEAVYANRNSAATTDFPVRTNTTLISFIGFDIDEGPFRDLERYGVRVTGAADRDELATVLSNLLEADITRLEASAAGSGQ